jgi:hypothetical protein
MRSIDVPEAKVASPHDDNYIAAGSTDGRLFVWDLRMPNDLLHELRHGLPICETPLKERHNVKAQFSKDERWMWDTGIRFCAWNHSRTGLVTGSSDGVVKSWDIFRSTKDAHTADLVRLDSAVMTGAYSSDFSRLVVGEVHSSVTLLEVGQMDKEVGEFTELHPQPTKPAHTSTTAMDLGSGGYDAVEPTAAQGQQAKFQRTQAATSHSNRKGACTLPLCRELVSQAIGETTRANHALSQARIPANLRVVEDYAPHARARAHNPTSRPCRGCGASMAPLASQDGEAWCQRCRFGCFRCGRFVRVRFPYDVVECRDCDLSWSVGAAGYDVIPRDRMDVDEEARHVRVREEMDESWEGELAEHYHSLWGLS